MKQSTLMGDPIIKGVGLPAYLASLILDLVIMVIIYLAIMSFELEVAIKSVQDA